jgi:outer membrane lipoprotein-sorting protein
MSRSRRFAFRTRWAVPAGAVGAVGMVIAGSVIAGAQAAPALPARTAAQLLADITRSAAPPSSLSGVIVATASLGLPQLPDTGGGISGLSLLTGSHTVKFWYSGPAHVRFAAAAQLGETDLRRDGRQVWLWDSGSQTATHIVLPARSGHRPDASWQAVRQVLAAVGPTTKVSVQQNVTVAGQAAYQLAIAPRDSRSLIGQILIAVDAHGYLPLRLQVFARGGASPAYQVGFTALSFARPAASNFTFTPPPGAKVKNVQIPSQPGTAFRHAMLAGPPGSASFRHRAGPRNQPRFRVNFLPAPRADGVERTLHGVRPGTVLLRTALHRTALPRTALPSSAMPGGAMPGGALRHGVMLFGMMNQGAGGGPRVIGKGWLSVLVLSPGGPGQAVTGTLMLSGSMFSHLPQHVSSSAASTSGPSANAYSSTLAISGPAGQAPAVLRAMLRAATPVHGSWGSGRLLRTSLLSVLLTNSGHVLIGAVTPSVLYADAAKVK